MVMTSYYEIFLHLKVVHDVDSFSGKKLFMSRRIEIFFSIAAICIA
jgi:hypothetical protein